jgi:predicted Fe-Mo cluster-binding NifX family protein
MEVKIAVASTDGKVVNQHFGRADTFYILVVDSETKDILHQEKREVVPVCHSGDHEEEAMTQAVKNLSDCEYILVSRIGLRARNVCEQNGISVFEIPGLIRESIGELLRYLEVQSMINGSFISWEEG